MGRRTHTHAWRPGRAHGGRPAGCLRLSRRQHPRRVPVSRRHGRARPDGPQYHGRHLEFLACPDPSIPAHGRDPVPLGRCLSRHQRGRQADLPGARAAFHRVGRRRHGVFIAVRLDHRQHRRARQCIAAGHAQARLPPDHRHGPDHGDRFDRHADPALRARRPARQPRRHLNRPASDRGHRSRPHDGDRLSDLHSRALLAQQVARPGL